MGDGARERRRHQRVKVRIPGALHWGDGQPPKEIEVIDLSESGGYLHTDDEAYFAEGTSVEVAFEELATSGHVVRMSDDGHGVGIEFDEPDTGLREFVRELLAVCGEIHLAARDGGDDDDSSN